MVYEQKIQRQIEAPGPTVTQTHEAMLRFARIICLQL